MNWASKVFSEHLAQGRDVHHLLAQQTLQVRVLILELLQSLGLTDLHAAILRAPIVKRRITDPVLPAELRCAQPGLVLLQHADDLFFREPAPLHVHLLQWKTD